MHKVATAADFIRWREQFAGYTDEMLAFARKDCLEAGQAMPENAGFYNDQASVIIAEQNRRADRVNARRRGRARVRAQRL